jgi:hypothetical protein
LRRTLLTFGGLGAVLGLARPAAPAHAAHDAADLGIGLSNPYSGGELAAATVTTKLRTATSFDAFAVTQSRDALGDTINAYAGESSTTSFGGRGLYSAGGANTYLGGGGTGARIRGGSLGGYLFNSSRVGGNGVEAVGGDGTDFGGGGAGLEATGGRSATSPGSGVVARGGARTSGPLAAGGTGVVGIGGQGSGSTLTGTGVSGQSDTNFGVFGQSSTGVGMRGVSFGASAAGLEGVASGSGPGVWGFTASGHAVLGNSTSGNGGVFSSGSGYGISVNSTSGAVGVYSQVGATKFAFSGVGKLTVTGTGHFGGGLVVSSRLADGSLRGASAVTSAEPMVEDLGRARLVNGAARVELEPIFAQIANTADYAVFLTPRGDCNGLFVTNQTSTGFDVRELRGGTSTLDFDYRVVAKRAGAQATGRFARVDEPPPPPAFPAMPVLPTRAEFEAERARDAEHERRSREQNAKNRMQPPENVSPPSTAPNGPPSRRG